MLPVRLEIDASTAGDRFVVTQGQTLTFALHRSTLEEHPAHVWTPLAGRDERAREVFERAAGHVNDVGLPAEEVDPRTGDMLGSFPQAFSHVGLVNAAWALANARER